MTVAVLVVLTLVAQRMLGAPGMPSWLTGLLLPMAWVVAPRIRTPLSGFPMAALALGLGWDVLLEPVIGTGGIAWSAAALAVGVAAAVVADRSPAAWFGLGALGGVVMLGMRSLAQLPLGLATPLGAVVLIRSALLTGAWVGLVGWILALDLPARWSRHRARRLH